MTAPRILQKCDTTRLHLAVAIGAFTAMVKPCAARDFVDPPIVSPDRSSALTLRYGERTTATEWHISLSRHGHVIFRCILPDSLDVRYVKASWSPSSHAVLLGENYKAEMDSTLLRIRRHGAAVQKFDLGHQIFAREEKEVPLHPAMQSYAPVARVTWSTVKWQSPHRCRMLYIFTGLGYEGEADVTVDFLSRPATLRISRLRPLAHPDYFNTD
jgi:hypothetical protein